MLGAHTQPRELLLTTFPWPSLFSSWLQREYSKTVVFRPYSWGSAWRTRASPCLQWFSNSCLTMSMRGAMILEDIWGTLLFSYPNWYICSDATNEPGLLCFATKGWWWLKVTTGEMTDIHWFYQKAHTVITLTAVLVQASQFQLPCPSPHVSFIIDLGDVIVMISPVLRKEGVTRPDPPAGSSRRSSGTLWRRLLGQGGNFPKK